MANHFSWNAEYVRMNCGLRGYCTEADQFQQVTIMRYKILTPILVLALLSTCAVAQAQRAANPYTPSRPTLSPYLFLTRQLPTYQRFVQPSEQQGLINRSQQTDINNVQQTQ
jgi:hypothetical protein